MMIGLGSFAYRWSCGFKGRIPQKPLGLLDLLERTERAGLELIQFADNIPLHERDPGEVSELAKEASTKGIAIELGMAGATDAKSLDTYLEYAVSLNCNLIRVSLDAEDLAKDQNQIIGELKSFDKALCDNNVRIAFENHFALASQDLANLVKLLNSKQYGVCLDVANSICAGEWPMETVRILAPYAINLHMKDCRFAIDPYGVGFSVVGTPLGQGMVDVKGILDVLKPKERHINIILEHWLPWNEDEESLMHAEDDWLIQSVNAAKSALKLHQGMS
jgi:sugar phosphate isomerase/epimerase|tara:strand:- start:1062 stop:1892 length:831 start_codon:yes stop_codon:yes gene_type:complete